jgi:hypothetical protein
MYLIPDVFPNIVYKIRKNVSLNVQRYIVKDTSTFLISIGHTKV